MVKREAHTGEDVLRAAFDLHYAALMRLCLALGEQPGDAEDIVQEAYVRAAPSLHELQPSVVRAYSAPHRPEHQTRPSAKARAVPTAAWSRCLGSRRRHRPTRGPLGRPQSPAGSSTRMPRAALLRGSARARDRRTSRLLCWNGQEPHTPRSGSASTGGRTMRIEEQLRDAIEKHVGKTRADEAAWSDLQRRVAVHFNGRSRARHQRTASWRPSWRSPCLEERSHCCGRPPHRIRPPRRWVPIRSRRCRLGGPGCPCLLGRTMERPKCGPGHSFCRGAGPEGRPSPSRMGSPSTPSRRRGSPSRLPQLPDRGPRQCGPAQKRSSSVDGTAITRNPMGLRSIRRRRRGERCQWPRSTPKERWWCGRGRN